jgi:BirA family biotin operon repressor/biotin-[acetyl-CoA-carboxylase] ligase
MIDLQKNYLSSTRVTQLKYFDTIGSTNDEALAWASAGADDFSLVVANEQTKGRGRFDRRWITKPGSSLAFSLILKPEDNEKSMIPLFSPLCGIAVREAVNLTLGANVEIKWPNDVLINRRKFCGILVEASWMDGLVNGIIMGIGINISRESVPPAGNQQFPATSLEHETNSLVDRWLLMQNVVLAIEKWRGRIGSAEFLKEWQDHLAFKGEKVRIEHSGKPSIIGTMKGINDQGNLVLIVDDDREVSFEIGDVHLRPGAAADSGGINAG